jgi:DNA polymerase I-like protein with 3'-5' exonuclease and polymerase domains
MNIQNLRRQVGIREAFIPRRGRVFANADYPQLELYCLAQCCMTWLGHSALGRALNAGLDPHLALAATILEVLYEDAKARLEAGDELVEDVRHLAKQANFGLPGGMGIAKFEKLVRVNLKPEIIARLGVDQARLKLLKEQWFETWPEMHHYFARIDALDGVVIESLHTKRFRGFPTYCAACNNGFQALGSDCAKSACWLIAKEQYVDSASPLFNTRTVAFVHDEFILEVDEACGHDAAMRLADVMVEGANIYLPDVPIPRSKVKPLLMRRWSKKAKPVYEAGRLVPWEAGVRDAA